MKTNLRIILSFLAGLATFYFTQWIPLLIIFDVPNVQIIQKVFSLLMGIGVGYLVWKNLGKMNDNLSRYLYLGAMLTGTAFFIAGFIGPMIFAPSANQGPLLGFILGPIGFILGLLGGGLYWWFRVPKPESPNFNKQ